MLYLFYGDNTFAMRRNLRAVVDAKRAGAAVHQLNADRTSEEALADVLASERDLFGAKRIVVLDGFLASDLSERIFEYKDTLAASVNLYVLAEATVESAALKKLDGVAKMQEFELPADDAALHRWIGREAKTRGVLLAAEESEGLAALGDNLWAIDRALEIKLLGGEIAGAEASTNPFEFADAFATRDRRRVYILFHKHLAAGITAQELFWKLWWQARTLMIVAQNRALPPQELKQKTGFHPFVIQKAARALSRFHPDDVTRLLDSLFATWRDVRLDSVDLSLRVEKILLTI